MAAEYVLIPRHKYEQLEKESNSPKDTSSGVDSVTMENNSKIITTTDDDGSTPPPNSNTESNQLDERNYANLDISDDSMSPDEHDSNDDYATSDILQSFNSS